MTRPSKLAVPHVQSPSVPQAHYNLGYFYSLEERWHEAEKALLKAGRASTRYCAHWGTLAGDMELGRLDRAQEKFLTTELTPDDLDIQLNLGILAAPGRRHEEALDRLDRCIEAGHGTDTARFHAPEMPLPYRTWGAWTRHWCSTARW